MTPDRRTGQPLHVAFLGTRGVPARYGGFETAVEEVGRRLAEHGHHITVYCRTGNSGRTPQPTTYAGMRLVHLPAARLKSFETLSHTMLSAIHLLVGRRFDAVIVCNAANAPVLPLLRLRRVPAAMHVDGLEWRRTKWGRVGRSYYRVAEAAAVRWADALIADAQGIEQYYLDEFGATSERIAYGAPLGVGGDPSRLRELGLDPDGFHLVVARLEPENHVDLMIEGYLDGQAELPLVVVGSTPYQSEYTRRIGELAASHPSVRLLGGVWDQGLLDELYAGALTYLHGHSVGGTNPSLLRAMGAGAHTIAYDVIFNREVAGPDAEYVRTPAEVGSAIARAEADPATARARGAALTERARRTYSWDDVAVRYEDLCRRLSAGGTQRGSFTGRRSHSPVWAEGRAPTPPPESLPPGAVETSPVAYRTDGSPHERRHVAGQQS